MFSKDIKVTVYSLTRVEHGVLKLTWLTSAAAGRFFWSQFLT